MLERRPGRLGARHFDSESGLRITADLGRGEVLEFLTCGSGSRLGCGSTVGIDGGEGERGEDRMGSRAFAYIDFTSRDEWRGGEHNKVRDGER